MLPPVSRWIVCSCDADESIRAAGGPSAGFRADLRAGPICRPDLSAGRTCLPAGPICRPGRRR
ncbi:hypothetical protein GCM10012284_36410 [Mangrovihabitans endophyticus]|uniref:Uncharacterized protein n=1 Tax=Mangrovihabitans endophyticus TaxID=1751298 RepID=A0A8J3FP69_9ACTN|nr:hypothetical protein GCM10012284_36410 [Mangrovihabitans endophyticus]